MQPNCQPYLSFNECELRDVVYILVQVCGLHSFLKLLFKKTTGNSSQRLRVDGRVGRGDFVHFDMETVLLQY